MKWFRFFFMESYTLFNILYTNTQIKVFNRLNSWTVTKTVLFQGTGSWKKVPYLLILDDSLKKNDAQPFWIRSLLCSMIPASCFPLLEPVLIDIWQYSCLNGQKITQGGSRGESGHTLPLETVESRLTRFQWDRFLCFLLTLP